MLSYEIRKLFLDFFEKKQHKILPSFSLVPVKDPSLLLINAGMAPMKGWFLGKETPPAKRIATSQKCVRVIDIEKVGKTVRHLTFFEMLGNFSFGDYFKEGAITYAWEFLVDVLKLPKEKLYVSVYVDDEEAYNVWKNKIGIPQERIYKFGEEHNFWSAGPVGPCGPDSEIFIDRGVEFGCEKDDCNPSCDCDRFIEVWNLVFMQYNRKEDGTLEELPNKNIDTGMGLERLCMILQNKKSPYETDLFSPIIDTIKKFVNTNLQFVNYIIADHIRASVFLIGDGVLPSNEGRGYVLRRLLRRSIQFSKIEEPTLYKITPTVIDIMKNGYPYLKEKESFISKIIRSEEEKFLTTVRIGEERLYRIMKDSKDKIIKGEDVFKLYDTFGFPKELTEEIAKEKGYKIDEEKFNYLLQEQKERARKSQEEKINDEKIKLYKELSSCYTTSFVGYDNLKTESKILSIIKNNELFQSAEKEEECEILIDRTPFYAEEGGQVGDKGKFQTQDFSCQIEITDTQKIEGVIVHYGKVVEGKIKVGDIVLTEVDQERRKAISRHHTATHLLQASLREVLGKEVSQSGSVVDENRLRFDFTYFGDIKEGEIEKVESILNKKILQNIPVNIYYTDIVSAKSSGAISLFDEKYKEIVRVIEIGDFSKELCGGTHCASTGEIGICKITSCEGIGAGVRRISAVCGLSAFNLFSNMSKTVKSLSDILKTPMDGLTYKIQEILDNTSKYESEISSLKQKILISQLDGILDKAIQKNNTKVIIYREDNLTYDELRKIGDAIKSKASSYVMLLTSVQDGKINFVGMTSNDVAEKGVDISLILKDVAKIVSGSAGGKKTLAQGGGRDVSKLHNALKFAEKIILESI